MKVRYTLPVRGMLRLEAQTLVQLEAWSFEFVHNSASGFVEKLVIEIGGIPKEDWPTLAATKVKSIGGIPVFPFLVNPNKAHFGQIEAQIINLESYLSVFGLTELVIGEVEEEWIAEPEDEHVGMQSGVSMTRGTPQPPTEPMTVEELGRCIVTSNKANETTAALAHFRMGQAELFAGRCIEAIRHLYFTIEYLFAKGHSGKKQTLKAFAESEELTKVVSEVLLESPNTNFAALRSKYPELQAKTASSFYEFLFDLRGSLQHANPHTAKTYHPSRQGEFEREAICILNVAEAICFDRVMADMKAVPAKSTTSS